MEQAVRVIVVTGDREHTQRIRSALANAPWGPYTVVGVERVSAALEHLRTTGADVVLLDLSRPDGEGDSPGERGRWPRSGQRGAAPGEGVEAVAGLSAQAPGAPVIALTEGDEEALAREALRRGAQDCLATDRLDRDGLARVIRYALERHRTERKLREASAQMEQLLTSISSILIGLDRQGLITTWNAVAEAVFGLAAEQALQQPLDAPELPWDAALIRAGLAKCEQQGRPVRLADMPIQRPDGALAIVGLTINSVRDSMGARSGFLLLGADITERVKARDALTTKMRELEVLNRIMMGREERILELKEELRALHARLGAAAADASRSSSP
jgi:PAS domain S-box-containing protein